MSESRYVKAPQPSEETRPLYEATLRVLSGEMSVTEAAASLGLSRNRFQTVMHRGLTGLLTELSRKPRGRRPMPPEERRLREELARLEKENARLAQQAAASARMMALASEWMHKGLQSAPRARRPRTTTKQTADLDDDEGAARSLCVVKTLHAQGLPMSLATAAAGVSAATARRWCHRRRAGQPMRRRRGPRSLATRQPAETCALANSVLLRTRGRIGSAALARVVGISRRDAGELKERHLTASESARREGCTRVEVAPGVVRGLDAMFVSGTPVLVSADGGVPFRTAIECVSRYDEQAVAAHLERDFELHGAPYVLRLDRWKAHVAPQVMAVLEAHDVLLMHGPPYCPRFYGQLERQNREHREWLESTEPGPLQARCDEMREVFNELLPRRRLQWMTAGEAWRARAGVTEDRRVLRDEVDELARRMKEQAQRVAYPGLYERLAIQRALIRRGLLRLTKGGWC